MAKIATHLTSPKLKTAYKTAHVHRKEYLSVPGYTKICYGDPETETLNTSDMGQET